MKMNYKTGEVIEYTTGDIFTHAYKVMLADGYCFDRDQIVRDIKKRYRGYECPGGFDYHARADERLAENFEKLFFAANNIYGYMEYSLGNGIPLPPPDKLPRFRYAGTTFHMWLVDRPDPKEPPTTVTEIVGWKTMRDIMEKAS